MVKVHRPLRNGIVISSGYGMRKDPKSGVETMHYGYDFACPEGTPIVACLDGKIFKAGWQDENDHEKGFGLRVWQLVKIGGQTYSAFYAHLSGASAVEGTTITGGTRVGESGSTGKSSGPHLHFELRRDGKGVPVEFI